MIFSSILQHSYWYLIPYLVCHNLKHIQEIFRTLNTIFKYATTNDRIWVKKWNKWVINTVINLSYVNVMLCRWASIDRKPRHNYENIAVKHLRYLSQIVDTIVLAAKHCFIFNDWMRRGRRWRVSNCSSCTLPWFLYNNVVWGLNCSFQLHNCWIRIHAFNSGDLLSTLVPYNLVMWANLNNVFSIWKRSIVRTISDLCIITEVSQLWAYYLLSL